MWICMWKKRGVCWRRKVLGKSCHFWHCLKAGPALEGGDEMALFRIEMALSEPEMALSRLEMALEMSLSLLL